MLLPHQLVPAAYHELVGRARGSPACTTFLLVAPDVDSLCAARLLAQLLKTDDVAHQTTPVGSWAQLHAECAQLALAQQVRSLVLVGLGAAADLYALLGSEGCQLPKDCLVHVIDAHRPIALANLFTRADYARALFDPRRIRARQAPGGIHSARLPPLPEHELSVVVWDEPRASEPRGHDGDGEGPHDPWKKEREAWEELEPYPESDPDDSDDSDSDSDHADSDADSDADSQSSSRRKRRRTDSPKPLSREQRRAYRAQLAKYESRGSSFGQSVAGIMYNLAEGLGRTDVDGAWLAILGLTYQLTNLQIDLSGYETIQSVYATEVARLSTTADSLQLGNASTVATVQSTSERDRSIRPSEELRFCLFRHWNLYDAMFHSGYLGVKMKLWTMEGRKKLSGLLAKMGLSLSESSETYAHMSSDLKASLFPMLSEQRASYGLWDLSYPSFVRKSGWRVDLSAQDYVDALEALLEAATGVRLDFASITTVDARRALVDGGTNGAAAAAGAGQHSAATQYGGREEWAEGIKSWVSKAGIGEGDKENARPSNGSGGANGRGRNGAAGAAAAAEGEMTDAEKRQKTEADENEARRRNFWYAWDALDPEDTTLLRHALPLSMALHRAVIAQGSYILDKRAINFFRSYRLAVVKDGPDLPVFQHPATLLRLAHWLVNAIRSMLENASGSGGGGGGGAKNLPFVLAALSETSDRFLVVGVVPADEFGDVRRNKFGVKFEEAATRSQAKSQQRYFDASVVEVRRDDFDKFLKHLSMH